jgi:hypothetical protein
MDAERHRLLGIYLNDHLGGSTGGVEMARRSRDANDGTEFGPPLAVICREIEEDRATLETVMEELGIDRSRLKPALAWLGEKVGRLKPNGRLRGYSPLSRVVELETLVLGITGKLRLWLLLDRVLDGESGADLPALAARAEGQRDRVEDLQRRAIALL